MAKKPAAKTKRQAPRNALQQLASSARLIARSQEETATSLGRMQKETATDATHLGHLDQIVWDFFATDVACDAVRQKVATLFPAHEVEEFTALFWQRIQRWRADDVPS